ncbi:MAG: hypothetical protein PHE59_03110 [Patescibacteria group bacterium]|nr:hypothetical protein [Patescibacteria group bacterium]MDD5164619.1 hypothetical protein [Patescibacteria group bacterium]MDD5534539.1 hypothetical protein [Patescibacteria group bacterium]
MDKKSIGAETAKLAGLHMDCNMKIKDLQLGLDEYECFLNLTSEQRQQALAPFKKDSRFKLANAFEIVVPKGYDHATRLTVFKATHGKEFYYYNPEITDKNFDKATTKLLPGRKFKVKVFQITETVNSEDCLKFLKTQKAVLTGAQGASLVYELAKNKLPKGHWYISFDKKDSLWIESGGVHRVPGVFRRSDGDFEFYLGNFEHGWDDDCCLLCFCDCD